MHARFAEVEEMIVDESNVCRRAEIPKRRVEAVAGSGGLLETMLDARSLIRTVQ